MREGLRQRVFGNRRVAYRPSTHLGLAYDMYAPVSNADGKVPDDERDAWFDALEGIAVSPDYEASYRRWEQVLAHLGTTVLRVRAQSRLLVGHGNPSASEVGLSVHHTWGTPYLPGSSLKGLLHHSIVRRYGPEPPIPGEAVHHPLDGAHPEPDRAVFQDVVWSERHIEHGPGRAIRHLFGAPAADTDEEYRQLGHEGLVGAKRGELTFHDAWLVPGPANPFVRDVLTVHQRRYYGQGQGRAAEPIGWPNDYDSPVPVSFLTVRAGVDFLIAVSGEAELAGFAVTELRIALEEQGVGGKTVAGYGAMRASTGENVRRLAPPVRSPLVDKLQRYLDMDSPLEGMAVDAGQRARWDRLLADLRDELLAAPALVRQEAVRLLSRSPFSRHRKLKVEVASMIGELQRD